jgi:hypothetical protein
MCCGFEWQLTCLDARKMSRDRISNSVVHSKTATTTEDTENTERENLALILLVIVIVIVIFLHPRERKIRSKITIKGSP